MDLTSASEWRPPSTWQRFSVIDSHTGGEPFRVVIEGLPDIPGRSVLERRRYAGEHLDHLRMALMWEPRGHADMYGGWIGPPERPDSDLSVLFLHNEGFSTMCGHGIIALTKVVLETGILPITAEETTLLIDTPAGQVTATAETGGCSVGPVRFTNVASFAADLGAVVQVDGLGEIIYDLGYGGAFYAYVDTESVGVDMESAMDLVETGRRIKRAVAESRSISHPDDADLGFLYGVIFTGPPHQAGNHSRNACVFADGELDRSPTGTGVSGRLAILHARGEIETGESITIESIVGSVFTGRVVDTASVSGVSAVIPEISGEAHIVGRAELWIDPSDPLNPGFLLR